MRNEEKSRSKRPGILTGSQRSGIDRWCRRRDLNPHGFRHTPLKRACLPFHHFGHQMIRHVPQDA